jgi:outer membrane protein insertion porin family
MAALAGIFAASVLANAQAQSADGFGAAPSNAPATVPASALSSYQGLSVSAISFQGVPEQDSGSLLQMIPQKAHTPLDRAKVRSSLKTLFATGRFSNLQVQADRTLQNEVVLVFVAEPNLFVGAVTVVGRPRGGPIRNQLINASRLELGQVFTEAKLRESIDQMKSVLAENGYYHAVITVDRTPHPETQQIDIQFAVERGEGARIGKVSFSGNSDLDPEKLRDTAKLKSGDEVRAEKVSRALQRLRKEFQDEDRLEAQVSVTSRTYQASTNTVEYVLDVDRGPKVRIRVEGADIGRGTMKRLIPVYQENAVDADLLNEGVRNLRDYFQGRGYFDAEVEYEQKRNEAEDLLEIVYSVKLGERHTLEEVIVEGQKAFAADIYQWISIQPAGRFLSHGKFSQSMMNRDGETILSQYRYNGFRDAKVTAEVEDDVNGESGHIRVIFHIKEGPRTTVGDLALNGVQSVSEEEIRNLLGGLSPGQPYSDGRLVEDRDAVLNYYYNHGFPYAEFSSEVKEAGSDTVNIVYTVKEGQLVRVDEVLIGGLEFTRPYIVNRDIRLKSGDPLSQSEMLESQRNLYDLGIFNEVQMAVQNPEGNATEKNVIYQFSEARRYTFNFGVGLEVATGNLPSGVDPQGRTGISPRVSFDVTRINFRGKDQSILFKSRVGRLQQRVLLSFDNPRWLDMRNWRLNISAFYDNSRDVRTFTSERLEGSVQLAQTVSRSITLLYGMSYRRVKVDPNSFPAGFTPDLIPLYSRPVRVGMPSFTFERDTRPREELTNPTRGTYNTANVGIASGYFGSEADFGRVLVQNSSYHKFNRTWVFARATRIGVESSYGDFEIVPLPERFFAGGGNSHRGFSINQAGPRDATTGSPLGGNAMFVNNLELRTPPVALPFVGDNISFAIFHDLGNVFSTGKEMLKSLTRFSQRDREQCSSVQALQCNLDYLSQAIGTGVRYNTPIGPVRLDLGYNLNPPLFRLGDGTADNPYRTQTLKRFNFFFSIGQTF